MSLNEVSNRDIKEEEVLDLVCAGYSLKSDAFLVDFFFFS